jgi:hypothetical protein
LPLSPHSLLPRPILERDQPIEGEAIVFRAEARLVDRCAVQAERKQVGRDRAAGVVARRRLPPAEQPRPQQFTYKPAPDELLLKPKHANGKHIKKPAKDADN